MIKNSNTFCLLPFLHIYTTANGDIVPCCESQEFIMNNPTETVFDTWNNDNYKKLRKSLLTGEKNPICNVCWHNEENGIESNRQLHNRQHYDDFIQKIKFNDNGTLGNNPIWLEHKVSNFCNLKCKMCSTHSSYKRNQDYDIISKYTDPESIETRLLKPTKLFSELSNNKELWGDVERLQFTGGEPIISQEHYDLLNSIPDDDKKHINLRYATNLTHLKYKEYDLLEIWDKFQNVNLKVSCDGINDVYDYIRIGGNFDILVSNMKEVNALDNLSISVGLTIQVYNVFQLPEFYDFFENFDYELGWIGSYILQTPKYLNISVFPEDIKNRIIKKLERSGDKFSHIIEYMNKNDTSSKLWKRTMNYTNDMDSRYGHDFINGILKKYI